LRATGGVTFSSLAGVAGTVMTDSSGNLYSASSSSSVLWGGNTAGNIWNLNSGSVGIGTSSPGLYGSVLTVSGLAYFSGGARMDGALNMDNNDITHVGTLSAATIDPRYNIDGVNYDTFASAISGGVKEEYVGKINISKLDTATSEYAATIDFSRVAVGSDLWVWRRVIDFNADNVDVNITPYGQFAEVYYMINGNKLIFRSDRPVEISYRLVGKRFDWKSWPTKALDQTEPGLKTP
jgi:hypothetical protein